MGYGMSDPNEMLRLHVYASAAGGDVTKAIEIIDEDRKAAAQMDSRSVGGF
jgi:hypothetical protein